MNKLLTLGLVCAFGSSAFAQQLVTNGNFATDSEAGWTLQPASSGSDQFVGGSSAGDPGNAQYGPSTYSWYAESYPDEIDDVLYQTIATQAGQSYTFVVNYNDEEASESGMDVWWNTSTFVTGGGNVFSASDPGVSGVWEQLSFTEVATSSSTVIAVGGYNTPSGILITDIGVEAVSTPEPAAMAVLGLGALALIRRRRNRS